VQALVPEDWQRLNGLLKDALELDPAARAAWLQALPADAQDLKPLLERLLAEAASSDTGAALQPVVQMAAAAIAAMRREQPGDRIGPWQLERLLAEGGMGAVWLAQRADGVMQRSAALKLPRAEWVDRGLAERIARERAILARLQHPNIAVLYDAGFGDDGRPYLALEYVGGQTIDAWARGRDLRQIVRLFMAVVRAVAYAHAQLVIHRDIKPGNVLVAADGTPKLLDFGISKLLEGDAPAAAETALTRMTGRALTLAYAAPELVQGLPVTVAADVYSLGVLLFELLTQARLYRATEARALEAEILRGDLRAPSAAVADPARARQLHRDLEAIVLHALKLEPGARYGSAGALADDLQRWLVGAPVRARPDSRGYRLRRFVVRNKLPVAAVGGIVLALAVGLGAALWQAEVARDQARRATALNEFVLSLIRQADPNASLQMKAADLALLAAIEERIDRDFKGSAEQLLRLRVTIGDAYRNRGEAAAARRVFQRAIDAAAPVLPPDDLRLLGARVRATDPHLIVSTAAAEQLAGVIDALRRRQPDSAALLVDALLNRHELAQRYGLPAYLPQVQRLALLQEADGIARHGFGDGSREQLRVARALAANLSDDAHGDAALELLDATMAQARARADGADSSVDYLLAEAALARQLCTDERRVAEGRAMLEGQLPAVRAAYGPTSVLLEEMLAALAYCGAASPLDAVEVAGARERPPSTGLLNRALEAYGLAFGALDEAATERLYRQVMFNADAVPEPALRARLTRDVRFGRICQLSRRGDAEQAERLALALIRDEEATRSGDSLYGPLVCLSDALRQQGRYAEAAQAAQQLFERCRNARNGCDHRALTVLALVQLDAGRLEAARSTMAQRLALASDQRGDSRFAVAYGRVLIADGRYAEAAELLAADHARWQSRLPDNPQTAELLYWLGRAQQAAGDPRGRAALAQARQRLAASPLQTHQRLAAADPAF